MAILVLSFHLPRSCAAAYCFNNRSVIVNYFLPAAAINMEANGSHLMAPIFQTGKEYVPSWSPACDPRLEDLPMMGGFEQPAIAIGSYLLIVVLGPKLMASYTAWNLRLLIIIYNAFLMALSLYMTIELVLAALENNTNWMCEAVNYSNEARPRRMAVVLWLYYFSKVIELVETVFFILRKKNNQVSFLHVYHHASMVLTWWGVTRWLAGGISFFSPLVNCIVHVVMYTYYFLSSLGPEMQKYLWWKRYITKIQLLQFTILILHDGYVWYADCGYPRWFAFSMVIYMVSFFSLFYTFYMANYKKPSSKKTA